MKMDQIKNKLPKSAIARVTVGWLFIAGGIFGFLPVLGFWMLPLGFLILSIDLPGARRLRRRLEIRWGRWRKGKNRNGRKD